MLQSFATVAFGIDFRNLGIRLPVLQFMDMHLSYARLLSFGAALIGMVLVFLFMKRTFLGTAIRAISQDRQRCGGVIGQSKVLHQIIHAIHADHDEFGVADPGHVDDAEDQVQAERQQRQHAAEQDAVHDGLEQVDIENIEKSRHRLT